MVTSASALDSYAETLSGLVTNKTSGRPSAGDDVVLIQLAQGMQELARTKTDSHGRYRMEVPDEGIHLLRVTHDKASYFKPVQPGMTSVDVDVFSAAAKVDGVTGEADVLKVQTDESGKTLRVIEAFFERNDSSPPKTQFGDRPFDFYLPSGAVVQSAAALSPGGMPVQAAPAPLGDPNHYAFIFPIRPGETRFQVTYSLGYSGATVLTPRPTLRMDTVAVILPKSMTFKAGPSSSYNEVQDAQVNAQTFVARNVSPSQPSSFNISGTGQLPRESPVASTGNQTTAASGSAGSTQGDTGPGGGLGNPVDPGATNDPWSKYRWWIIGGLGLTLAAGAGVMLRRPSDRGTISGAGPIEPPSNILLSLKEEMFRLETERLQGRIENGEYLHIKTALDIVLKRVLGRT